MIESTPPGPGKQLSPLNRCALDFPLPGIPSDVDDNEDTSLPKQPVFNFATNGEDSWSSSDSGGSEQEGEYTGKFRVMQIPTKVDPPTSGTRDRIEQWGRPISPFPHRIEPIPENEVDNGTDETSDSDPSLVRSQFHVEEIGDRHVPEPLGDAQEDARESGNEINVQRENAKATEISETEQITPSKDPADDNHANATSHIEATRFDKDGSDEAHKSFVELLPTYPQEDIEKDAEPGDEGVGQNGNDTPAQERDEANTEFHSVVAAQQENLISTEIFHLDNGEDALVEEEQTDEEIVAHTLSEEPGSLTSPLGLPLEPQLLEERIEADEPMIESEDAESEGDSSDDSDLSVVKIVSDDPWAAARAAAILKQVCSDSHTRVCPSLSYL